MTPILNNHFHLMYPTPLIRGRRIVRHSEQDIGDFALDWPTAQELGRDNVGVFVSGITSTSRLVNRVARLCRARQPGRAVILPYSSELMAGLHSELCVGQIYKRLPEYWEYGSSAVCTIESLKGLGQHSFNGECTSILLLDPECIVYRARAFGYSRSNNDRPRHIAQFRARLARHNGWMPPLFLFTTRLAKSLNTDQMLAPYGIEAWWFVDGSQISTGEVYKSKAVSYTAESP